MQALLQLPPEKLIIAYTVLERACAQLRQAILKLNQACELQIEPALQTEDLTTIVQQGLNNLGLYHSKRPLLQNQEGDVTTQDLSVLLYYHNKLQGYALEKYICRECFNRLGQSILQRICQRDNKLWLSGFFIVLLLAIL